MGTSALPGPPVSVLVQPGRSGKAPKPLLRFCYNAQWIDRIPKLSPIKIDAPDTEPLTEAEYNKLLEHAKGKISTCIKLMRWSGLAIRDASTLERADLSFDKSKDLYHIIRERTKTGEPLYIPVPKDVAEELLEALNGNAAYVFWNKQKAESSDTGKQLVWVSRLRKSLRRPV